MKIQYVSRAGSEPISSIASKTTCNVNTNYNEISEHVMFHIHFKNMSLNISSMLSVKSSARFVFKKNVNNSVVTLSVRGKPKEWSWSHLWNAVNFNALNSIHKTTKFRCISIRTLQKCPHSDIVEAVQLGPAKPPWSVKMSEPTFQAQPIKKDAKSYAVHSLNASTESIITNGCS